jgi:hypothetical protein
MLLTKPFAHEISGSTEFLGPYSVVAAGELLEIGTAAVSPVLSLSKHLSHSQSRPVSRHSQLSYSVLPCQETRHENSRRFR